MLIICDKLNMIVSLKEFYIESKMNTVVEDDLDDINTRIMAKAYNYGSTNAAVNASKSEQRKYLETLTDNQKYSYYININECYQLLLPKIDCENIYNGIKSAIKENLLYFEITNDMIRNSKKI